MATKKPPRKRPLTMTDSESDYDPHSSTVTDDWPRFIMIESTSSDASVAKLSPFAIDKGIQGIAGAVKDVKKLRSGHILVECGKKSHADNLLRATTLAGVGIKASPHRTLNSSKGVIRTRDLSDVDEDEICRELRPQGVLNVKRITIKRDGGIIKTGTYILTFSKPVPPKDLKIGYLRVVVDIFIPNPLRCFQCQKFGHGKDNCRNETICLRCGQKGHDNTDCHNQAKCTNCLGDHVATSKDCPVWIKEKNIQRVKTESRISYPDARRLVEGTTPSPLGKSYSAAVKPVCRSIDCQTELTWLSGERAKALAPDSNPIQSKKKIVKEPKAKTIAVQTEVVQVKTMENINKKKKKLIARDRASSDRVQKGDSGPHVTKNKYSVLQDIDMAEVIPSRGRSVSPKVKLVGRVPVKPPI